MRLHYLFRTPDGNPAEVCGELLHRKEMKLPAIVAELAAVYHEVAPDENRMKYWLHEIKLHRSDLSYRPSSSRPPLEYIDARILRVLESEPSASVRTITEFLKIHASTVHLHLIISLNMKSHYFKWIPHCLDDLRPKQIEGARQLFDVVNAQERCHSRDLITGDETWVYLDMKSGTVGFRLTHNYESVSKGQLQASNAC
jgi:hypothetical protein